MQDKDTKRLIAVLVMVALFIGLWLLASLVGYVEFNDIAKVRNFLVMTSYPVDRRGPHHRNYQRGQVLLQ